VELSRLARLSCLLACCLSPILIRADTVKLTQGRLFMSRGESGFGFSGTFTGGGFTLTDMSEADLTAAPGWINTCCTIDDFRNSAPMIPLIFGAMKLNGQLVGYFGGSFNALTFHSSLAPSGILTVIGIAVGSDILNVCTPLIPEGSPDQCPRVDRPSPLREDVGVTSRIFRLKIRLGFLTSLM
jgi:hypothetical protein